MSFEDFFAAEYRRLVRALAPSVGGGGAAEEAAQAAMVKVYERWEKVAAMESPVGYAYTVGLRAGRRRFRRATLPFDRDPAATADPIGQLADRDEVIAALRSLTQDARDAVILTAYLGLDSREAGAVLGIDAASVRSRVHRARAELRPLIEHEEERHGR